MECLSCGRWAPPDPETGYDGDPLCPSCTAEGWSLTADGEVLSPEELQRARAAIVRVPRRMARATMRRTASGATATRR